ncbi:hypothetical protein HAX54_006847, partial [Datura stramonium]|nr:hypothetical protein [Datura stramonium]
AVIRSWKSQTSALREKTKGRRLGYNSWLGVMAGKVGFQNHRDKAVAAMEGTHESWYRGTLM